mgnify:FL=1
MYLTRKIRKLLYRCEGRQVVLRHKTDASRVIVWNLGEHDWTRQPRPAQVIGDDTSRFECGITWVTKRHQPERRPIAHFRYDGQPSGQWYVYIPQNFNPYNTLIEHARRYNLVSPNPNNTYIPGE